MSGDESATVVRSGTELASEAAGSSVYEARVHGDIAETVVPLAVPGGNIGGAAAMPVASGAPRIATSSLERVDKLPAIESSAGVPSGSVGAMRRAPKPPPPKRTVTSLLTDPTTPSVAEVSAAAATRRSRPTQAIRQPNAAQSPPPSEVVPAKTKTPAGTEQSRDPRTGRFIKGEPGQGSPGSAHDRDVREVLERIADPGTVIKQVKVQVGTYKSQSWRPDFLARIKGIWRLFDAKPQSGVQTPAQRLKIPDFQQSGGRARKPDVLPAEGIVLSPSRVREITPEMIERFKRIFR